MALLLTVLMMLMAVAAAGFLLSMVLRNSQKDRSRSLERADAQFSRVVVASTDPRLSLDAPAAEVMSESETHSRYHGSYTFTRIVRNEFGEYFMLKSTAGSEPFVKHVSQDVARTILKAAYRAPDGS